MKVSQESRNLIFWLVMAWTAFGLICAVKHLHLWR
jgi:hypothetical protein